MRVTQAEKTAYWQGWNDALNTVEGMMLERLATLDQTAEALTPHKLILRQSVTPRSQDASQDNSRGAEETAR